VALLRDEVLLQVMAHDSSEEYSSWLLPAVAKALQSAGLSMGNVDGYAVAAGPGSFTGVRVGLTTVKAWSEVYGKRIAAVSRLEAVAVQVGEGTPYVAAFANAQRGQVFGAVYRRTGTGLELVGEEMVISPGKFVACAAELADGGGISWVSTDADCVLREEAWKAREMLREKIESVSSVLAPAIGRIGAAQLAAGRYTNALGLDANYVRRSDAEIFWKGGAARRMGVEVKREGTRVAIRALRPADAVAVTNILPGAPEAANWSAKSFGEAVSWSGGLALVSEGEGEITGFLVGRQVRDEAEILNLGVKAARRRQGAGTALLKAALAEFQSCGVSRVFLEVRESNEAGIAFYAKHGFCKMGRRPGYYREPAEAAALMEKKLTQRKSRVES
jgi:tRNA threonylcarbamoyl adenosine modification protein YeaZ/ribosomal-protein-alanine acetyltransferase